jgi:hypothetical protein
MTRFRDWIQKFNFYSGNFHPVRQLSSEFPAIKSGVFFTTTIGHVDCCHRCALSPLPSKHTKAGGNTPYRYWQNHGLVLREHNDEALYVNCRLDKEGQTGSCFYFAVFLTRCIAVQGYGRASDCPSEFSFALDGIILSLLHVSQQQQRQIAELALQLSKLGANATCTEGKCSV